MSEQSFWHRAVQKLSLRQRAYQSAFATIGSPAHMALMDLAVYCNAFAADPPNMTHDQIMMMHGRRQAFFRIFKHVKLQPHELEIVCAQALQYSATRIKAQQGMTDD